MYSDHIRIIAARYSVKLELCASFRYPNSPSGRAGFNAADRKKTVVQVEGWADTSSAAYYTALHELGHVHHRDIGNHRRGESWARKIGIECRAWVWAYQHASEPPDAHAMRNIACEQLGSYLAEFTRRCQRDIRLIRKGCRL